MKAYIYLSFFLVFIFADCKNEKKEIECKLIDCPASITGCGVFSFIYAMKLQKTNNKADFIGLVFCPDRYGRDFFQVGQKYLVSTTDTTNVKAEFLVNYYENENLPIYGIKKIVLIQK